MSKIEALLVPSGAMGPIVHFDLGTPQLVEHAVRRNEGFLAANGPLVVKTGRGAEYRMDSFFRFEVPVAVEGVDGSLLDPRATWANADAYDRAANSLVDLFRRNFSQFTEHVDASVRAAGPPDRLWA